MQGLTAGLCMRLGRGIAPNVSRMFKWAILMGLIAQDRLNTCTQRAGKAYDGMSVSIHNCWRALHHCIAVSRLFHVYIHMNAILTNAEHAEAVIVIPALQSDAQKAAVVSAVAATKHVRWGQPGI